MAEIQPARQLADDQNIGASDDLVLERRRIEQTVECLHWPQVRENVECLANSQQSFLRALRGRQIVELRQADRAQQRGVRRQRLRARLVRERRARLMYGDAPEQSLGQSEFVTPLGRDVFEDADSLAGNFGTDAVPGQNKNIKLHGESPL